MNEQAEWSGERQRASLTGFARIRAVLWRRSLLLYESWVLRKHSWYRPLRRRLARAFGLVDLDAASRLVKESDIFGETPALTVATLLGVCERLRPEHPRVFVDLGSGRGLACLVAASLGYRSSGLEKEADWVLKAGKVARDLDLPAEFFAADFLDHEWPSPSLVFTVGTAYSSRLKEQLAQRFLALASGTLFLVGDWDLSAEFVPLWEGRLPVEWGVISFGLWQVPARSSSLQE